jgi:glutamate-ammonia-ligase adenylyltransferase
MPEALVDELLAKNPSFGRETLARLFEVLPSEKIRQLRRQDLPEVFRALTGLSAESPVECLATRGAGGESRTVSIYVIGYDHPQLFTILTGVLASGRLDIREGRLITSDRYQGRRLIIDYFSGSLPQGVDFGSWSRHISRTVGEFYEILEGAAGDDGEHIREIVQQRVIELVSASLERGEKPRDSLLNPIHLSIEQKPRSTLIEIKSSDTPFFLFSLSSVLNLHRLRIEEVNIETKNGRLVDTIEFTDMKGAPITSERKLNRIKLSILISKQFTYFLDQAPDPTKALNRFDSLIQDVQQLKAGEDFRQLLASQEFHGELARLLGTSDFIWEDFIRIQRDSILPMLRTLNRDRLLSHEADQMENALEGHLAAAGVAESVPEDEDAAKPLIAELNAFKKPGELPHRHGSYPRPRFGLLLPLPPAQRPGRRGDPSGMRHRLERPRGQIRRSPHRRRARNPLGGFRTGQARRTGHGLRF